MRKFFALRRAVALGLSLTLLTAEGGCGGEYSGVAPSKTFSATVKSGKAGTYKLGDITVTVPEGAVPKDTKLTATSPVNINSVNAPLGATSVKFDLSFDGGLEPSKPLKVAIPLKGDYLPDGVQVERAFLYSPDDAGNQWLVPSAVTDGVLYAQLNHLSPKIVSYLDDASLLSLIGGIPDQVDFTSDCKTSVETPSGKVKLTGKNWSNGDEGSPINACLTIEGSDVKLTIKNRVSYILSVASTNVSVDTATSSTEDGIVVELAKRMYPARNTKAFLGRDSELEVALSTDNLPTTLDLIADTNTYFAEISWASLKFLLGVFAGANESDKIVELADKVISAPEVVDCLRTAVEADGDDVSALDKFNSVTGKCTELIVTKASAIATSGVAEWGQFWNRIFAIGSGISTAVNTVVTAYYGIKLQLNNTMRITVSFASGSSGSSPTCLTVAQAERMLNDALAEHASLTGDEAVASDVVSVKCFDGWAVSHDKYGAVAVFKLDFATSKWSYVSTLGAGGGDIYCETGVPSDVLEEADYSCS
ncbi:MAG: hypothetical protein PVI21_02690 [Candidatus Woesebacteria bacterium]|jgi:hypothetical protein